jgi:hypothetical protein
MRFPVLGTLGRLVRPVEMLSSAALLELVPSKLIVPLSMDPNRDESEALS